MSIYFDERHTRAWHGYSIYEMGKFIIRSGYCLVGLADRINLGSIFNTGATKPINETITERFYRRGESILEHAAKVAYLCTIMESNFPGFFNTPDSFDSQLAFVVALIHDATEVFTGDIPDDGNPARLNKDELERELFDVKIAPAFSREDYMLIRELYASFQNHDTPTGQALYCLDKLEAVLTLLWLEQYDTYGLTTAKPDPTGQDIHYMKLVGTPCATDCWAAHVKDRTKDFPDAITRHIYGVLCAAVMEVRGEWFPWWDKI